MSAQPATTRHLLSPHPASAPSPVRELSVAVQRDGDTLLLGYQLVGDLDSLMLPEQRLAERADDLWRHTCFEAFVARGQSAEYREYNFAPSGAWAVYHFDRYRADMRKDQWIVVPSFKTGREADTWLLDATVDLHWLNESPGGPTRLGVTAVIEDRTGALSYWALKHPAEKPDFHHPDSFVAEP